MVYSNQKPEQVREEMRLEALEKENQRLKAIAHKQSKKLHRLRKVLFFMVLFFAVLFFMLGINGFFSAPNNAILHQELQNAIAYKVEPDTAIFKLPDTVLITNEVEDVLYFKIPADGILFSVQIGAYAGIEMGTFKLNLLSLQQYSYEGINQYSVGLFADYNEALAFLNLIKQMGFDDGFIISTQYGKRIGINDALDIKSKIKTSQPPEDLQLTGELLNQSVIKEKFTSHHP